MGKQNYTSQGIEKVQKNIKSISNITPILAIAILAYFCTSLYYDKTGLSLWGVPMFLTFTVLISLYSLNNLKKELNSKEAYLEKSEEELQKLSSTTNVLLSTNIVAVILVGIFITYLVIRQH